MSRRPGYAWKDDDGKYRLSVIGPRAKLKTRPATKFDTPQQLLNEAARRELDVEWQNGKPD